MENPPGEVRGRPRAAVGGSMPPAAAPRTFALFFSFRVRIVCPMERPHPFATTPNPALPGVGGCLRGLLLLSRL